MAGDVSKLLKDLQAHRQSTESLLGYINSERRSLKQELDIHSASSNTHSNHLSEIHHHFTQLKSKYSQAVHNQSNELALISDCLERIKKYARSRTKALQSAHTGKRKDSQESTGSPPGHSHHHSASSSPSSSSNISSPSTAPNAKKQKISKSSSLSSTSSSSSSHASTQASAAGSEIEDVFRVDGNRPPLMPNSTVAALVDEDSKPRLWILASVIQFRPGPRPRYEVVDLDPGDADHPRKRYTLDIAHLIALPTLSDVPTNRRKHFQAGERILAVYPEGGITVLYPATVVQGPKRRKNDTYLLQFDDDDDQERAVSVENVAPLPEEWAE